ncbi:MAG: WD40 repeat domain-containing protein [Pirellulales bacterium]|nr:WD40 repeat domain-containing protein [Pirellulales bacterium]
MQAPATDPTQTHVLRELKHGSPLLACRFDPAGQFLFAAAQDNTLRRFRLDGDEHIALAGHQSWPLALAIDPSGKTLVSGGCDGRLLWWPADAPAPQPSRALDAHAGWIRAVAVSPDGQLVASAGNDLVVRLWSLGEGTLVRELPGHESHVYSLLFDSDGKSLLSGDLKGVVRQWDVAAGSETRKLDAAVLWKYDEGFRADIGGVRGMALRADRALLACAGITNVTNAFAGLGQPIAATFDFAAGQQKVVHRIKEAINDVLWNVAYHPDGYLIGALGGSAGGFLAFWRPEEEFEFHRLKLAASARDLALHPAGLLVATAEHDGVARIYELRKAPA